MNTLPPIGAKVRLSAKAIDILAKGKGRTRDPELIGEVVGHIAAKTARRALVQWPIGSPEPLPPAHLEIAQ